MRLKVSFEMLAHRLALEIGRTSAGAMVIDGAEIEIDGAEIEIGSPAWYRALEVIRDRGVAVAATRSRNAELETQLATAQEKETVANLEVERLQALASRFEAMAEAATMDATRARAALGEVQRLARPHLN